MIKSINRVALKRKLDRNEDFVLVDALPEDAYREGHLPRAINLPTDQARDRAQERLPDKNAEIVVYCGSSMCTAAEQAAKELESLGYKDLSHFHGGKKDWVEAGLPLEQAQPQHA